MSNRPGLSAAALKWMMAVLMVFDHLYAFLPGMPVWFHWLGRLVAPVFCFLMTESLRHTHSRAAYLRRLTLAGLGMLAGNLLLGMLFGEPQNSNIFLSLAAGAAMVLLLERRREPDGMVCLTGAALLFLVSCFWLEGGPLVPAMAVIFYFLHDRRGVMCLVYAAAMPLVVAGWYALGMGEHFRLAYALPQMLMVFAALPILLYNGRRGPGGRGAKWFFYWFYPLHIWALYLIARWMPGRIA